MPVILGFLLAVSLLVSGSPAAAERAPGALARRAEVYRTYTNARFAYSVSYPARILIPQGEPTNGDGQVFRSKDGEAEMRVFGSHNALDETLKGAFDAAVAGENTSGREVTYKLLKSNFFVVSGVQNGKVFYQKTMLKNGIFKTLMIEYNQSQKALYDPITTRIVRSFVG